MNDSNTPTSLAPGTVLTGNYTYTIERVLGAGGFGITYLAVTQVPWGNVTIDCRVALKEHFFSDFSERAADGLTVTTVGTAKIRSTVEGSLSDFVAEAQRLQKLGDGHPNIVKVNEVFRANDTAYYAMEYLEGISLAKATAGNPVSEESMLAVMGPIIDAVAFLHSERMLHLDIKPENIVLADGGRRPVLIDFGQSKHFLGDGSATATVNVKGVSHGFAPAEQYDGIRTFAPTADVYALGATMMACLTGTVPPKAIEWQTAQKARAIDALPVSPALKDVLARALADDPAARFPDAAALANALASNAGLPVERRFLSEESASRLSTAGPASNATRLASSSRKPSGRNRLSIILIALAAVAIGAGAYFFAFRSNGPEPQPAPAPADTAAIAQNLETEPVVIDNSAAEAAAEADRQRQEQAEADRRRRDEEQRRQVWQNHRTPRNLYLAVERDGSQYYFSQSDWSNLPAAQKGECRKLGVVINNEGERFILALEDAPGFYTWQEAMSRFGNRLPTKQQAEAWIHQQEAVQSAIRAFGGHIAGAGAFDDNYPASDDRHYYFYWTRTEYNSSHAWGVTMTNGHVHTYNKTSTGRVRPVAPVAESAI